MDISSSNPPLRAALDLPDGTPTPDHHRLIEGLRATHPHNVRYVTTPARSTCGMHALNLTRDPIYRLIARDLDVYASPDFFAWLQEHKFKLSDQPTTTCLALYFAGPNWKHVGILRQGVVRSKWGLFPIYDHPIAEVPARYGNRVQFSPLPVGRTGSTWFRQYARARGVPPDYLDA